MATHSSILAWRIPWTEDLGGLQFLGLQRVWQYWATEFFTRCNATTLKCYNHGNWEEIGLHIQIFTLYLFVPMCLQTGTCWINLQGIPSGRQHQSEVIREEVVSCRTLGFRSYIPFSSVQLLSHVQLFATPWIAACQATCPSPTPGVHSNPCPSCRWCHPAISSSVVPFSSCPNPSQHQSLFQWVNSLHEVAKVLEFQL